MASVSTSRDLGGVADWARQNGESGSLITFGDDQTSKLETLERELAETREALKTANDTIELNKKEAIKEIGKLQRRVSSIENINMDYDRKLRNLEDARSLRGLLKLIMDGRQFYIVVVAGIVACVAIVIGYFNVHHFSKTPLHSSTHRISQMFSMFLESLYIHFCLELPVFYFVGLIFLIISIGFYVASS